MTGGRASRLALVAAGLLLAKSAQAASPGARRGAPPRGERVAAVRLAGSATAADDEIRFKLSLPTMADRQAWMQPGFRLELGYVHGRIEGLGGAPGGMTRGVFVRVGARLDERWSLLSSLSYAGASEGMAGLRFLGTIDPTWHFTERLSVAFGLGLGGRVEPSWAREDPQRELNDSLVAPYTHSDHSKLLPSCNGTGVAARIRASWTLVLGPISALVFHAELDGQQTRCELATGRVEPDTARAIVRRQYQRNVGAKLGAGFSWR